MSLKASFTIKHFRSIIPQDAALTSNEKLIALAWAPNNRKLAACGKDKVIYLYDEIGEQRDRFPTRPIDPKKPSNYVVTGLAFSPDSTKIGISQSDGIVFIYKIGDDFKQKKTIINKLPQPSGVLGIIWPNEFEIICSLVDGKLRHSPITSTKGARSRTFYNPESYNVALVSNPRGTEIAAAYLDGKIGVFQLGESEVPILKYVAQHSCPAFALAFGGSAILAGGSDNKITVYDNGRPKQTMDFSKDEKDVDFVSAVGSPSGLAVVFGGYDRLRIIRWVARKKLWEEGPIVDIQNLYTVTALSWNKEGTKIVAGTMTGGLHLFETVLKKSRTDSYEIIYTTPHHAIVTVHDPPMTANIKSKHNLEILELRILGHDRYAVAHTLETLLICDIERNLVSEIRWDDTDDSERFYFDNPNACMVFNNGELTLIEYGKHKVLGTFRTEFMNPHLISLRINERIPTKYAGTMENKKLAYLLDLQTITIVDLVYNNVLGHVTHDSKIDWLELNETAVKLLFRDRKLRLVLLDIDSMEKNVILQMCNFVQWVPASDVIVAQSKKNLCIWYNVETPDQYNEVETNGLAYEVVRDPKESCILVQEGNSIHEVPLDASRIEFGTAMLDGDFLRAMLYLEIAQFSTETDMMWKQLANDAVNAKELKIAEKACYASNDFAKAKFLSESIALVESGYKDNKDEHTILLELQARMSVLSGDLQTAENIFMDNDDIETAIQMYISHHRWKDAIKLAQEKQYSNILGLIKAYFKYLEKTNQAERAAEFLEENENIEEAASLYLKAGLPIKAARLIQLNYHNIQFDPKLVHEIGNTLQSADFTNEAGEFFDAVGRDREAFEYYKRSARFELALRVAKRSFPDEVVLLEEEWADYLADRKLMDAACNHYIEAGRLKRALEVAIEGRQWNKAATIIEVFDDVKLVMPQYMKLGDYYSSIDDDKSAEKFYVKGGNPKKAVEMYLSKGMWENAFTVASNLGSNSIKKEIELDFLQRAEYFLNEGDYGEAERLYCAIGQQDRAITMYGEAKQFEDMLRLVEIHHPPHLPSSYKHVAELLKKEGNYKGAELYHLKNGDHKLVLEMYVSKGLWEDALRVAKSHGGTIAFKQVVYKWALSLEPELGIKLLQRFDIIDESVDYMCETKNFPFAIEIAKTIDPEKVKKIHVKYGKFLEERGELEKALQFYVEGGMPNVAIDMFLNRGMFEDATEVAENYCPEEIERVYLKYATVLFEQQDYVRFEAALLKAKRPEIGIQTYKSNDMWMEAFRLCKEYSPGRLPELQRDFDRSGASLERVRDKDSIINQGREFEKIGENERAIEYYLKLNPTNTNDKATLGKYWKRAAELALKFLKKDEIENVIQAVCPQLISIGNYSDAAILYIEIQRNDQAVESLIAGDMWEDAERLAEEFGPELYEYVRARYTDKLKKQGQVDQLSGINLSAALEVLYEKQDWPKLLEKAKVDESALFYYLGKYITKLIDSREPLAAIKAYETYGVPTTKTHGGMLEGLFFSYFSEPEIDTYENNKRLRDLFYKLLKTLEQRSDTDPEYYRVVGDFLFLAHLYTNRAAFRNAKGLEGLIAKISISVLRYGHVVPIERSFFEAGVASKEMNWNNMALAFLNHYLDIFDAIEEGKRDTSRIDHSIFMETDIPRKCTLPPYHLISPEDHEEIKDWVLSASMDRNITEELRKDNRMEYEASLVNSHGSGTSFFPCVVTGYPVIGNQIKFLEEGKFANRDDWNKLIVTVKNGSSAELIEIHKFITKWCGSNPQFSI